MKIYRLLIFLSFLSCSFGKDKIQADIIDSIVVHSKNKTVISATDSLIYDEFIFGKFCGECDGICAPMYKLSTIGNASTLFGDLTNDFFQNESNLKFATNLNCTENLKLAYSIMWNIPKIFNDTSTIDKTYGCPDCSDGCGIYIECKTIFPKTTKKVFWLDLQRNKDVTDEIYNYAQFVRTKIDQLHNNASR